MSQFSWGFLCGVCSCIAVWQRDRIVHAARRMHVWWKARKA